MKQKILDALKAKFTGVSEKILDRIATNLAKTVTKEEDVAAAVEAVTFQQVLDSYGDSRATDATKTAVLNYERKYGLKDGKSAVAEETKPAEETEKLPEDTPAWAKAMMKTVETLSNKVENMQGAELTKSRKQKLEEIIAPLSELQRKGYERINLKDLQEEEFNNLLTEIQGEVGEISKTNGAKGAVFGQPTKSRKQQVENQKEATDEEADAVVGKMNI